MSSWKNVSIIIAAINETFSLKKTVDVILETCNKEDLCEIFIVLCKKTTPECVKVAEEIRDSNCGIPITIYYQKKPFVGPAYQEAFQLVKGSHLIMMSADLETPPELVQKYIEIEKQNPDKIVTSSRWIKGGGFEGYSRIKWLCNYFFQKIMGILFRSRNTDMTYGYRIFPTDLMQSIRWEETRHPFFLETALKPLKLGVELIEIPAQWRPRQEGESVNGFFANFAYFKTAFRIRKMSREDILKK